MIIGVVVLVAVLGFGAFVWVQRANYVAAKLAFVTDPLDLPVGPTPESAAVRSGHPRMLVIGDSRVARWIDTPRHGDTVFFMRGAGGETSAGALRRIERELSLFKPDIVLVMTGINDLVAAAVNPDAAPSIEAGLVSNIIELADFARGAGAAAYVATIIPPAKPDLLRRIFVWSDGIWDATREANGEITDLATEKGFRVIDLAAAVDAVSEPLDDALSVDTLHWNAEMYRRLNTVLMTEILQE